MGTLKKIIKDATLGALIPGSIAHNCSRSIIKYDMSEEIRCGTREPKDEYKLSDKIMYSLTALATGLGDLGLYALYSLPLGIDIGLSQPENAFIQGTADPGNIIEGLMWIALPRAAINMLYSAVNRESKQCVEEAISKRQLAHQT